MFKPNEENVKKAFEYVKENVTNFFNSQEYSNYYDRFARRLKAYRRQHDTNAPKWRSKLHFATFFLGCKALDIAFKKSHRNDPFITIALENSKTADPSAIEKARLAHYDINHDLYISNFSSVLDRMYWYVEMVGGCVGREYVYSDQVQSVRRERKEDMYGFDLGAREVQDVVRKEHTKTDLIHPLNYAHNLTKPDFLNSRWGACRFEVPPVEIYKMLKNKDYYQPGVKKLIDEIEKSDPKKSWTIGKDTFYAESYDNKSGAINSLVLYEYTGDFNYKGNYDDNSLYYMLYSKSYDCVLSIRKSQFPRKHLWKLAVYQDPYGPFQVGPCDSLLPLNLWKNSTVNQYNDYANATLKYMWEVDPEKITGGLNSLVNGLPGGLILAEPGQLGQTMKSLNRDRSSLPPVGDIMDILEKEIESVGPSSNLRGKESGQLNDTATGIGLMAQREDDQIAALQDECDDGIVDAIQLKIQNRQKFMTQPVVGEMEGNSDSDVAPIQYFPWELAGQEFVAKVRRETSDIQSGKYMSFLKLIGGLMAAGVGTPQALGRLAKKVGESMGIDEVDELGLDNPMPPQIPGGPQGAAPQGGSPNLSGPGLPEAGGAGAAMA